MKLTDIKGTVTLNNGVNMPYFGLGVFLAPEGETTINAIHWALEAGYRHIDTATLYENEKSVGDAIRTSGIKREKIFVTTKVWNSDQGYEKTMKAFDASLKKLQTDYIDLYLVHWPVKGKFIETWKTLEDIYSRGLVKAIGVSNFKQHQLETLFENTEIMPMVNQVEYHPYLLQSSLHRFCEKHNIQFEAWSPLMQGKVFDIPELQKLALKYDKSIAQLVLRWNLQKGVVTIPKSVKNERIISNADIFDFSISEDDMQRIDALDRNSRVGADPDNFDF